jgi:hypothetical protein
MGISRQVVDFDGGPPPPEVLRDKLTERLGSPVELVVYPAGFTVGVGLGAGASVHFSVTPHGQTFELEGRRCRPQYDLVVRILTGLGGQAEPLSPPEARVFRHRFTFAGAPPTPEQLHARIQQETGLATSPPSPFPLSHELRAPALKPRTASVRLHYDARRVRLDASVGRSLIWDATEVLVALGGRLIPMLRG